MKKIYLSLTTYLQFYIQMRSLESIRMLLEGKAKPASKNLLERLWNGEEDTKKCPNFNQD